MDARLHNAHEKRDYFLLRAEDAERHAEAGAKERDRQAWLDIAKSWRFLAEQTIRSSKF